MTVRAKRDQIPFGVVTRTAAKLFVMDCIAPQHPLTQSFERLRIESQARGARAHRTHEAFSLRPPRNVCLCTPGRDLKNLYSVSTSPSIPSHTAGRKPFRKSHSPAQHSHPSRQADGRNLDPDARSGTDRSAARALPKQITESAWRPLRLGSVDSSCSRTM